MLKMQSIFDWQVCLDDSQPLSAAHLFEQVLNERLPVKKVLKDTYNSSVLLVEFNGRKLIVKYPTDRNRRLWIRFTTLFRKGEAMRAFLAFYQLRQLNLNAPLPILAAQKKRWAMVVDSFLIYEYVDGGVCQEQHLPALVRFIQTMHAANLVHGDAHTMNFIAVGEQIWTLDVKAIHTRSHLRKLLDYVQLTYNSQTIEHYFGGLQNSRAYRWLKCADQIKDKLALGKKCLKQKLGLRK